MYTGFTKVRSKVVNARNKYNWTEELQFKKKNTKSAHSPGIDDFKHRRLVDIQIAEPVRVGLPDGQVPFQKLLRLGHTELSAPQKPQKENRI